MSMTPEPEWEAYEYPYSSAPAELRRAMSQLLDPSRSADDLELFLYSEVLGLVMHQGDLYSGVLPLVHALRRVIEAEQCAPGLDRAIVGFLEYVFSRYVRDERSVLVRPFRYGFCEPTVDALSGFTVDAFRAFKALFHEQVAGRLPPEERHAELYYRYVLGTREQFEAYASQDPRTLAVDEASHASLVIGMRLLAELQGGDPVGPRHHDFISRIDPTLQVLLDAYIDPGRRLDAELRDVILLDAERPWCWGLGSVAVIGATAAVLNARRGSEVEQMRTLEQLLEIHEMLVHRHATDELDLDFSPPQALLEDVSALVYLEHLGRGQPLPSSAMTTVQARFFEIMSRQAKLHTYSMLRAGVLPVGLSITEVYRIGDIYRCYA